MRLHAVVLCLGLLAAPLARADGAERCAPAAAAYHRVNEQVLAAILRVEGMREDQVIRNANGSVDVGRAGINSVHFSELARYGVSPRDLVDGCKNVYVAAWLLRRNIEQFGNTWAAYAAYHSRTPYYNRRYQVLIANELIRMGVLSGPALPVPPVRPGAG